MSRNRFHERVQMGIVYSDRKCIKKELPERKLMISLKIQKNQVKTEEEVLSEGHFFLLLF